MPPDFLNSREDALLFWALAVLGFALYKDPRGITRSLVDVLASFFHWKLLRLFGSAMLYCAAVVYAAEQTGLWHTAALKATVFWFVGTGVVFVGEAVAHGAPHDGELLRRALRRVVAVTIAVEFVVNVYALPLMFELVGVFVVMVFAGMQVVVQGNSSYPPATGKFINGVLTLFGVVYLGYFVVRALGNLDGFLTRETAEDFFVGPILTLAIVPFLYAIAWLSRREQQAMRRKIRARLESSA